MSGHFLQSKKWEEFQRSLGREVFRIEDALVTKLPLVLGKSYFYCGGCLKFNFKQLKEGAVFLKFEPMSEDKSLADELLNAGFKKSKKEVQPQKTVVLDITKSGEELLLGMRAKTRYNIRVAERNELRIMNYELGIKDAILEEFWRLLQKTTRRDGFFSHERNYYEKLLRAFSNHNSLFLIRNSKSKVVAANVVLFYGDTAYYLHGASDYEYRATMAPYLLHWETIKYAKEKGYKNYDLWGIDEKKWPGVTRFKKGFGGRDVEYVGSYDYVFKGAWYKLYKLRQFIR